LLAAVLLQPAPALANGPDWDIAGGHFYTQTVRSGGGFSITDQGQDERGQVIRMWSEFQRLGGVRRLGYPTTRRFMWGGFVAQATQRVIMQWQPELNAVVFINVFDLITAAGKDDYLEVVRQVPRTMSSAQDIGRSFQAVAADRLALLNIAPAIQAAYNSVQDPMTLYGLPTSPVTDMGNVLVVRCQRVVFQLWKQEVPWAHAGQVTVALGGDIAQEVGLITAQDSGAVIPEDALPAVERRPARKRTG
jgi:hypothetical protein